MNRHRAVAAIMVLLIATGAGCSGSVPGRPAHRPGTSATSARMSTCPPAPAVQRRESTPWPSRTMLRESTAELISDQLVDPAARAVFLLASKTNTPVRGPWVLCRVSLATGAVRLGPTFPVGGLAMASGYLWVYSAPGSGSRPVVTEVNPLTLQRVWLIRLPSVPASPAVPVTVTAGPAGSVWIGSYRTLVRVSVSTGTPLTRVTLPPSLAGGDVSADPAGATLYVSAAHVVRGGMSGLVLLEYDARSGRKLAAASSGLIRYSVAGAALTAVPGGVWASFRTGMLGLTIHLGTKSLQMIAPPGPAVALAPATGIFHWPMYETTIYGGGALWVANQVGIVACLDPRSGKIRASEHLPESQLYYIDAIDPAARMIFALHSGGLLQITPPRRCWS
jgi:hypothetical protein